MCNIAKVHRDTMREALVCAQEVTSKLTRAGDANDKMAEQVETTRENVTLIITQAFEQLHQTIEERKKTLLSEMEAIALSKATALSLHKEQLMKMQDEIGHFIEMTSHILQNYTDHDMVALGDLLPTELKATLKKKLSIFGHVMDSAPSPSQTTWSSESVAKVKEMYCVKVESMTSKGERYPYGGLQVKAELRPKSYDGSVIQGEVEDHGDGTYTITLIPQTAGPHQFLITMDGQHVQNSTCNLNGRRHRQHNTLCDPEQVIHCSGDPCGIAIHDSGDIYVTCSDDDLKLVVPSTYIPNILQVSFRDMASRLDRSAGPSEEREHSNNSPSKNQEFFHVSTLFCEHEVTERSGTKQNMECSTCQRSITIPEGGVNAIPQNLHLGFEVKVAGYMSSDGERSCDACIDGSTRPAVVFCCTFHHPLCKPCYDHHKCKIFYHYELDHRIADMCNIAKVHRDAMKEALVCAQEVTSKLIKAIDANDKMAEQVETTREDTTLIITQAFEQLHQTIEERKKTLLSEMEAIALSKTTALTLHKEQLIKMQDEIEAKVKEMYCVKVACMTSKGERCPYGGLQVKAELRPKSHDEAVVPGEVEDHGMVPTPSPSPLRLLVLTSSSSQWMVNIYRNSPCDLLIHAFLEPRGLALDPQGNIHLAACGSNSIKVFTPDGTYVRSYGDAKFPTGIVIDEEGKKIHTVGNLNNPDGFMLDPKSV
eukprot:Em0123g9a